MSVIEKIIYEMDEIHKTENRVPSAIYLGYEHMMSLKLDAKEPNSGITISTNPKNGYTKLAVWGVPVYEVAKDEEHWRIV